MKCFNCKMEGHMAAQCTWIAGVGPAPARPAAPPRPASRVPGVPPTGDYQAAKAELGIPRNPDVAALMGAGCPWCAAGPWQHCLNRALGTVKERAHDARYRNAGIDVPLRPALADAARRQVDEVRAERAKTALR